jgi:hypothetical protein
LLCRWLQVPPGAASLQQGAGVEEQRCREEQERAGFQGASSSRTPRAQLFNRLQ